MIRAEITGRLIADPIRCRTDRGVRASTSVAVAVGVTHRRPATELVVLSADGRVAAQLLQFRAGDDVTAVGRLTKVVWTVPGSEEHSSYWRLGADQIVSAPAVSLPADGVDDLWPDDRS
jgi:hypothetical protein